MHAVETVSITSLHLSQENKSEKLMKCDASRAKQSDETFIGMVVVAIKPFIKLYVCLVVATTR